jgi:uncharacterized membrane protein YsdA (DUF1294 family)
MDAVLRIGIALLFLAVVSGLVARGIFPAGVLLLYLTASGVAAIAYALDKSAAERGGWRTSESTLHVLAIAGGWPGALIAQRIFRHKSRKRTFQTAFVWTAAVNCAVLILFWRMTRP